jgi:hypothetical protein
MKKETYIWGAGHYGVLTALQLENEGVEIKGFIDKNANKIKTRLGLPVFEPDSLMPTMHVVIAIQNEKSITQIKEYLVEKGFKDMVNFEISKEIKCETHITQVQLNIADVFFNKFNLFGKFNRYDIIVRYMAIENYYGNNETGFELYKKMQDKRIGEGEARLIEFQKLMLSYENGYNETSSIILNATLNLIDGSHRMALHIYKDIKKINCICDPLDTIERDYSLDWFYASGFTLNEIKLIQEKYNEICKKLNTGFMCTIWSPVTEFYNDIINEMSYYGDVSEINTVYFSNDHEFNTIVKGIYYSDDIAEWKIEKKLDFMKNYKKTILFMKLRIDNPFFRIKSKTGFPLSRYMERVKYVFRERYKSFVPNYFHDVIIHIADNYNQSIFIDDLLKIDLNIDDFFVAIKDLEYVVSKIGTPYMTKEFPYKAPLNKDADILCNKKSYDKIVEAALNFTRNFYSECINVETKVLSNQILIRMELNGFLIYQFDISEALHGFKDVFIEFCIETRRPYNNCFATDGKCEYLIRLYEYKHNLKKEHHFSYLQEHKNDFEMDLFNKYLLNKDSYKNLLESLGLC